MITGNCVNENEQFKIYFKSKFNIKDLGNLKYFLGIEVIKIGDDICLSQRKYCLELLKEYVLLGCKPVSTPMEPNSVLSYTPTKTDYSLDNITGYQNILGKLIYLTHTRPDIAYSVHCLTQYMHSPLKSHLNYALNVLGYLKNAPDKGYHSVPPPLIGNFIPRKPDLTFIDEIVESENMDVTTVVTPSNDKTVDKGVFNTVESNTVRGECCALINKELVSDEIQGRHKHEPEFDFDDANIPVTTAGAEISTANPEVKTIGDSIKDIATKTLVYIRRSVAKAKDKGKAKMEESESAMTKTKRQQEQERLGFEVVVRLQVELDKEER
ncbi:ribonuclease H-like domain-containing protein [Tanacetum coccineum]